MMRQPRPQRPKQDLPRQIVDAILYFIGHHFYPDRTSTAAARKLWAQDRHFYRRHLITWAAAWLDQRGVTLKPERFQKLICDKLLDAKLHLSAGARNWPRYLTHCIQDHFHHHGEAIYNEAKALRAQVENTLGKLPAPGLDPDPIRVLAMAHALTKPKPKKLAKPANQPDLFQSL